MTIGSHHLGGLFGLSVTDGSITGQPGVARPVDVVMYGHGEAGWAGGASDARSEEGRVEESGDTYAGKASGLYPRL